MKTITISPIDLLLLLALASAFKIVRLGQSMGSGYGDIGSGIIQMGLLLVVLVSAGIWAYVRFVKKSQR